MMSNLSNFELTGINLTVNQISTISSDAFADFPKLNLLDLSYNPIPVLQIQACLKGMTSAVLRSLFLGSMKIASLPENFFQTFFNKTFKKVDLQNNTLKLFNNTDFAPFWKLDVLDLLGNQISDVSMTVVTGISSLILEQNHFQGFPDLCLHRSSATGEAGESSAFWQLRSIYMVSNPVRKIDPAVLRGQCLPHLLKLDLSNSLYLETLQDNFIADLPRLSTLMLNSLKSLKRYEPKAFNSSSLTTLSLTQNRRLDKDVLRVNETFLYSTALEELGIKDTVVHLKERDFAILLQPLKTLQKLSLEKIRMSSLQPGLLSKLPNLQYLLFAGNGMTERQLGRALENVTSLKTLNVQANNINLLTEDTLPLALRENLTTLDLSINPFACNCEILWFRRWLDEMYNSKKMTIVSWRTGPRDQYWCATPDSRKRESLASYYPTNLECALYVILGVTGGVVLVLTLAISVAVYRYRWYIRFYIYRLRRRRLYKQIEGDDGANIPFFRYDAYLAHSPRDIDWIMAELLALLEGEHDLKVFLEERDTIPGSVIVDNYSRYMDQSSRILLVISDSYNQDGWRLCEFEHILYATIEQQKDVIVVLLGDVTAGRMTCDMRRMVTRGTFLQWGDTPEARQTFKNGLKVALKTKNVNQDLC